MRSIHSIFAAAALTALMAACSGSGKSDSQWSVSGKIDGADSRTVTLQRFAGNRWVTIDSARTDADGSFSIRKNRMDYPDFYRLCYNDNVLYFPIDSTESVTVEADTVNFASGRIAGSQTADLVQRANDIIAEALAVSSEQAVATDSALKRRLYDEIITPAPGDLAAFYVITRNVGNRTLFDPADRFDFKLIRAVANFYAQYRPADPRTAELRSLVLPRVTAVAQEVGFPEISLMGLDGNQRLLSDLTGKGKPVIVCFSAHSLESAMAVNQALAFAWHEGLADIYQISFDPSEVAWREVASNLPWTSVYNTTADGDRILRSYNVGSLPTLFIIDRQGSLAERVDDISQLQSLLKKY